jgi:hypothetical protein
MIKKFLIWFLIRLLVVLVLFETYCRIFVDKRYFQSINLYSHWEKSHPIDYLFIGSSRTAVSLIPEVFKNNTSKEVINAGRGYSTSMIHYKALAYVLKCNKDALKNCNVLIEAPGGICFTDDGSVWFQDENPHLIVPYINRKDMLEYIFRNKSSITDKVDLTLLYSFASWRDCFYLRERMQIRFDYHLNKMDEKIIIGGHRNNTATNKIAAKGGTKNDSATVKMARQLAVVLANKEISEQKILTQADLGKSMINKICTLITRNGGQVYLLNMPLASVQSNIYATEVARKNKQLFDQWLLAKNIPIINISFEYTDQDFPDYWHLSESRAEEFSKSVLDALQKYKKKNGTSLPPCY